jgi:hypothetical protein
MTRQQTTPAAGGLALLPLPDLTRLTEQQRCGTACVWDGVPLPADAIGLGQHTIDGRLAFLRGCRLCVRAHVLGTDAAHRLMCEQCVDDQAADDDAVCETGRALRRLVLEHGQ